MTYQKTGLHPSTINYRPFNSQTQNLINFGIENFVHAHFKNKLPFTPSGYFSLTTEMSQKNTRSTLSRTNCLNIPRFRTNRLQKCIKYQEVKIWNYIPADIYTTSPTLGPIQKTIQKT